MRNDLTGALEGQVEFAQTHTINPAGNAARTMPTLVAERAALLLFSPVEPVPSGESVTVTASANGALLGELVLAEPNLIPRADMRAQTGRDEVVYTRRAWTTELPWSWMKPGLELSFATSADGGAHADAQGLLAAAQIEFAPPSEIVISSIELGMLTDYPTSADHYMFAQPEKAAADYFQTIPVAKMHMAVYEPVRLDRVIVASGKIYEAPGASDSTDAGVYSGDLRENVGKAQVSTGINLANFGITSAQMNQSQPSTFNERIIHHACGLYKTVDGAPRTECHGLSGGNGMATIFSSAGNELSHELGHSYGLGHYPGWNGSAEGDAKVINAVHHSESGWGYIAYRDRMRSNLAAHQAFSTQGTGVNGAYLTQNYAGQYNYHRDAMSGGENSSTLSRYTLHTGYSATAIQKALIKPVPDTAFPSGYRSWDATTGTAVDAKLADPQFAAARPAQVGVPVFTLLGGYNPQVPEQTVLYPAFRSNYGNVFELPQADPTSTDAARSCWMSISYQDGHVEHTALDARNGVKQFNINVADAAQPTGAELFCRASGVTTQLGNSISIATGLPAMRPAVTIGGDAGYEALRAVEVAELDTALLALADTAVPVLDAGMRLSYDSWKDDLSALSAAARAVLDRAMAAVAAATAIDDFVAENQDALSAGEAGVTAELTALLQDAGMSEGTGALLPRGGNVTVDNGLCLNLDADTLRVSVDGKKTACSDVPTQRWVADSRGAIHSEARPDLCVEAATPVRMTTCSPANAAQIWVHQADGHLKSATSSYLDLNRSTRQPGMYGHTTGSNQVWKALPVSANPVLLTLSPSTLLVLSTLALDAG
ncbi:M66 family metalloprotease [Microterricola viridarii]|uniref:Ricin-type beta-trefoil lectin domain-containing protein n=1 Tax=Microterricola viridarii TaxID=412690 RepID=A0A1H1NHS4_9MICO|nr:M66 family metalloprotease [Microterricola viridarii]SDR98514.1 Ricin-type beta-trefoil lectin domain-containing protein [Microterricola viridarii]